MDPESVVSILHDSYESIQSDLEEMNGNWSFHPPNPETMNLWIKNETKDKFLYELESWLFFMIGGKMIQIATQSLYSGQLTFSMVNYDTLKLFMTRYVRKDLEESKRYFKDKKPIEFTHDPAEDRIIKIALSQSKSIAKQLKAFGDDD